MQKYPETSQRLSVNASIVEDPLFESVVIKFLSGKVDELSGPEEAKAAIQLKALNQDYNDENGFHPASLSLRKRDLK